MPIISVNREDTFEDWRVKTNQISQTFGDLNNLDMEGAATPTNLVEGINAKFDASTSNMLAMILALGSN